MGYDTQGSQSNPVETSTVESLLSVWAKAVQEANVDTLSSLVTEDAEFWTPGLSPLIGRQAERLAFEPLLSRFAATQDFHRQELILTGDWAFLRGIETNTLKPKEVGDPVVRKQRAFSIMRRCPDGNWRFARGKTHSLPEESPTS